VRIEGVIVAAVDRFPDNRGSFAEIARAASYPAPFVQVNHSFSREGVLRGLHYHREQADLWYVVRGRAQVALVDLRGEGDPVVETMVVSSDDPMSVYIPPGVAHGYLALTDLDLVYLVTRAYDATDEYGIAWNDPALAIPWAIEDPELSERDQANPPAGG
jgi:dTDP-4-dehydrorhamnose 3,5-epimerase